MSDDGDESNDTDKYADGGFVLLNSLGYSISKNFSLELDSSFSLYSNYNKNYLDTNGEKTESSTPLTVIQFSPALYYNFGDYSKYGSFVLYLKYNFIQPSLDQEPIQFTDDNLEKTKIVKL